MKRFHCPSDKTWSWTLHLKQSVQVCVCSQLFLWYLTRTRKSWTLDHLHDEQTKYKSDILVVLFDRHEEVDLALKICSGLPKYNHLDECALASTPLSSFLRALDWIFGVHCLLVHHVTCVNLASVYKLLPSDKPYTSNLVHHTSVSWFPCKERMVPDEESAWNSLTSTIYDPSSKAVSKT